MTRRFFAPCVELERWWWWPLQWGQEVVGGTNLQGEQMDFGMRPGFSWGSVHSNITVRYPNGSVE